MILENMYNFILKGKAIADEEYEKDNFTLLTSLRRGHLLFLKKSYSFFIFLCIYAEDNNVGRVGKKKTNQTNKNKILFNLLRLRKSLILSRMCFIVEFHLLQKKKSYFELH